MSSQIKRASGSRPKKRAKKFYGRPRSNDQREDLLSASTKKLVFNKGVEMEQERNDFSGYRMIDIDILKSMVTNFMCCKMCNNNINIEEVCQRGLASKYIVNCSKCGYVTAFWNGQMLGEKKNIPEINTRFVYAMRCVGQGHAGMETFSSVMELPPPIAAKSYNKINQKIKLATYNVAQNSMKNAALAESVASNGSVELTVSGDGSWKTRGHSSLTGVCSLIGSETGQVIDVEIMSSYCKGCEYLSKQQYSVEKLDKHKNVCQRNHTGSAGKMEVDGMVRIFKRSEKERGMKYVKYIGDGDTKTFLSIKNCEPYGSNVSIEKIECVAHIQKRMGTRLRNFKKDCKSKKLSDGKPIGGKNRLTDKIINEFTSYYGNAIREHKNSLSDMRKAIWAIFHHKRSTDSEPVHDFCPDTQDTWCKYIKAKRNGDSYVHKNSIPVAIMDAIKPIFKDLSDPKLLRRCLGGKTQNANESFNSTIWRLCPKISGASRKIVEIATHEAVILFNEGHSGRSAVLDRLGLARSYLSYTAFQKSDAKRVALAEQRALFATKEHRKSLRQSKSLYEENVLALEGPSYAAGQF